MNTSFWKLFSGLLLGLGLGCGSSAKMPPPVPVRGQVTIDDKPATGGSIYFTVGSMRTATAEIQPDGSFTLTMQKNNGTVVGIPPGKYSVIVQPPAGADGKPEPFINLAEPVEIKESMTGLKIEAKRSPAKPATK